jgi:hypothetical protein
MKKLMIATLLASAACVSTASAQIVLQCYVDTPASDPWVNDYCSATGGLSGPYSTTANFQVSGQIPGRSYSYEWSNPSCGTGYQCTFLPITVVPPATSSAIDMEVIVTDLTTSTQYVVDARAEYFRY